MEARRSDGVVGESVRFYLPALDGLRFIAFLLVLIHHTESPPQGMVWIKLHGWVGVELFFAISGFLFFSLLRIEEVEKGNINIQNFYVRRLLRLYPLMVAFPLLMLICFGPITPSALGRLLGIAFFSDNFLVWLNGYNKEIFATQHLWTLSYEFQIYLIIPLLFLLFRAIGPTRFLYALGVLWIAALGARLAFILVGVRHSVIWVTPFLRPESTFIGLVLGLGFLTRVPAFAMAALFIVAFFAFGELPDVRMIDFGTLVLYPICAVICGAALWLGVNTKYGTMLLSRPLLVFLGKISFGLYVFHILAIKLMSTILIGLDIRSTSEVWNYGLRLTSSLAITIAISALSYFLFERFFLRAKLRFSAIESRPI